MIASLVILLAGMLGIGTWIEKQIEAGVIHRTGVTTALYVDSFVAPNLQELGFSSELQPVHVETLSKLVQSTPMGRQIVAFKVWDTRGRLLYSTDQTTTGRTYPMHEGLLRARLGEVVSEISPLEREENAPLAELHDQLLETYSPVWLSGTDQVIAVAEFYQLTEDLESEIGVLKRRSWVVVGISILVIYLLLSFFVRRASDTITQQQAELGRKVTQLTALLSQNRELHEVSAIGLGGGGVDPVEHEYAHHPARQLSVRLLNESFLRRVGSELHDGPAQDLGLSLLKLDSLAGRLEARSPEQIDPLDLTQMVEVQSSLSAALKEMRGIAAGLSLPQLSELSLPETVIRAVRSHERRTGTQVVLELENVPDQVAEPLKITVYRLIQEALNNAYRHAGGIGQQVRVFGENDRLVVTISDSGPGFQPEQHAGWDGHLGLVGMRERVESIGGLFKIVSHIGQGTRVIAHLPFRLEGDSLDE